MTGRRFEKPDIRRKRLRVDLSIDPSGGCDLDEARGVVRDVWPEEVAVDDGEDAGIDANGSGESRDDDERNNRVAADEAETVPEVVQQAIEKSPVVDGFGDFAGQGFRDEPSAKW